MAEEEGAYPLAPGASRPGVLGYRRWSAAYVEITDPRGYFGTLFFDLRLSASPAVKKMEVLLISLRAAFNTFMNRLGVADDITLDTFKYLRQFYIISYNKYNDVLMTHLLPDSRWDRAPEGRVTAALKTAQTVTGALSKLAATDDYPKAVPLELIPLKDHSRFLSVLSAKIGDVVRRDNYVKDVRVLREEEP